MRIGELAERTGLSRDTIRFYERSKLIESIPGDSTTNAYRHYPENLVKKLKFIHQARTAGISVAALRDILDATQGDCDKKTAKKMIKRKLNELKENLDHTRKVIDFLESELKGL